MESDMATDVQDPPELSSTQTSQPQQPPHEAPAQPSSSQPAPPINPAVGDDDEDEDNDMMAALKRKRMKGKLKTAMEVDKPALPAPPPPPPPARKLKRFEKLTLSRIADERKASKAQRIYLNVALGAVTSRIEHRRRRENRKRVSNFKGFREWMHVIQIPTGKFAKKHWDEQRYIHIYGGHPNSRNDESSTEVVFQCKTKRVAETMECLLWEKGADVDFKIVSDTAHLDQFLFEAYANFKTTGRGL